MATIVLALLVIIVMIILLLLITLERRNNKRAGKIGAEHGDSPAQSFVASGDRVGSPRLAESPFAPARSPREVRAIADGLPVHRLRYRRP